MVGKIILYLAIISFICFIISMARINEYVRKKYPKLEKEFYKDLHVPALNAIFFPIKLFFFSDKIGEKDEKIRRILMIYRINFIFFLISIIIYFSIAR